MQVLPTSQAQAAPKHSKFSTFILAQLEFKPMSSIACHYRRGLDILGSLLILAGAWPLIGLMAVAVRIESSGNPFFLQTRIGRHGKPFRLIKMRTLYCDQFGIDLHRELDPHSSRITPLGRILRRSKLDELPQLLNILLGHMTFVGPRPDIPEQVALYTTEQQGRLRVRPGLTGAAQVCGNTVMPWSQRIEIDNWYIDHQSLWLDLRIIVMTVRAILAGEQRFCNRLNIPEHVLMSCAVTRNATCGTRGSAPL